MLKKSIALCLIAGAITLVSCQAQVREGEPTPQKGLISAFQGIAHLVLSPFQIAAGLMEGIASLPYYAATGIHKVNEGLLKAQSKVSLEDTYQSAYGTDLSKVKENGDTGKVFRRMKDATQYFQNILKQYGVSNYQEYILTSIDTANEDGYTLFAVVHRPQKQITVNDKMSGSVRTFTVQDRLYYEPYRVDVKSAAVDKIIDFAGLPVEHYKTQKMQAILLTIAANAVVTKKTRSDYWETEEQWMKGGFKEIMAKRNKQIEDALGL